MNEPLGEVLTVADLENEEPATGGESLREQLKFFQKYCGNLKPITHNITMHIAPTIQ